MSTFHFDDRVHLVCDSICKPRSEICKQTQRLQRPCKKLSPLLFLSQTEASIHHLPFFPPVSFSPNSVPVSAYFNYLYCYTVFQSFGFAVLHGEKLDFVVLSCFIILTICGHNFANAFSQQWGDRLLLWTRMLTWRRQEILLSYSTQLDLFNYEFRFSTRLYAWSHSSADMDPAIQLLE